VLLASKPGQTTIIIDLGLDQPGDQGEGLVTFKTAAFKANNVLYEGIEVATIGDARDIHDDLYEFWFKEGTNEAKFCKPALPAVYRLDKAELDLRILAQDAGNGFIIDGRDAVRVNHEKRVQKNGILASKKTFEVLFPSNIKLSQRAFGVPIGKEGEFTLAAQIQYIHRKPIGAGIRVANPPGPLPVEPHLFHSQITWRFANAAKDQELVVAGSRGAATIAAAMAGL
jgi:hypothetical protein